MSQLRVDDAEALLRQLQSAERVFQLLCINRVIMMTSRRHTKKSSRRHRHRHRDCDDEHEDDNTSHLMTMERRALTMMKYAVDERAFDLIDHVSVTTVSSSSSSSLSSRGCVSLLSTALQSVKSENMMRLKTKITHDDDGDDDDDSHATVSWIMSKSFVRWMQLVMQSDEAVTAELLCEACASSLEDAVRGNDDAFAITMMMILMMLMIE